MKVTIIFISFLIILTITTNGVSGLQRADSDLFPPSFSTFKYEEEEELSSDAAAQRTSINLQQLAERLSLSFGMGGGLFAGFKLVKFAYNRFKDFSGKSISSETMGRDLREIKTHLSQPQSQPQPTTTTTTTMTKSVNGTLVEEMKKEQEELWRFLHSLFKTQEEMISKLDRTASKVASTVAERESSSEAQEMMKDLSVNLNARISDLLLRIDKVESKLRGLEDGFEKLESSTKAGEDCDGENENDKSLTPEAVKELIRQELKVAPDAVSILRKEVKTQMLKHLKEHDDAVVAKMKAFGDEVKKMMVKGSHSGANTSGKQTGSSSSSSLNSNNDVGGSSSSGENTSPMRSKVAQQFKKN